MPRPAGPQAIRHPPGAPGSIRPVADWGQYPTRSDHLRCVLAWRSARRDATGDGGTSAERRNAAGARQGRNP